MLFCGSHCVLNGVLWILLCSVFSHNVITLPADHFPDLYLPLAGVVDSRRNQEPYLAFRPVTLFNRYSGERYLVL